MGRHSGDGSRSHDNDSGAFGNGFLRFLAWWHKHLFGPIGGFFSNAADRVWAIRRSRRRLICAALGILALGFSGLVVIAVAEGNNRDFAIVTTQGTEEGILVEEDYSACLMEVDLHGQRVSAETSCNTSSSFPAGTKVSVVRDPDDTQRLLAVSPGQDWHEATSEDIWPGLIIGVMFSLLALGLGYRTLLHPEIPESPLDQQAASRAAGTADGRPKSAASAALDRFGESWESRKETAGKAWINFVDMDIRIRGSILGALVIAVTGTLFVLGSGTNAELAYDRSLVRTQPVVNTMLLDRGGKGMNPVVRFGTEAVELDHGLRWEAFRKIGETVPVVEDPQVPERLIPVELADSRGLWGMLRDNAPMILGWIAIAGFLGWMFIPRELAAVGEAFEKFMRGGKSKGRH